MKRMNTMLLVMFLAVGLVTCKPLIRSEPRFGREYNIERMKVGVPIIPDDWELFNSDAKYAAWVNPARAKNMSDRIPLHYDKALDYRTGSLLSETDTYYGKEDYTIPDGG